jgi:tRNA G10  N-methylase Trm11
MVASHPAKFSTPILERLADWLDDVEPTDLVLDPFAGTGLVHSLPGYTVGIEIERDWAALSAGTIVGNAVALPFRDNAFDVVLTSPTYGNRMADHHNARDASKRNTYRHTLGRPLHNDNTGAMQWGPLYRRMHEMAWCEVRRVLKPGAPFVLNVSDHIRAGRRIAVCDWHTQTLLAIGFAFEVAHGIETQRQRFGANGALRVDAEYLMLFRNTK